MRPEAERHAETYFRWTVERTTVGEYYGDEEHTEPDDEEIWIVNLPHQCEEWTITPRYPDDVPCSRKEAIELMLSFLTTALKAYEILCDAEDATQKTGRQIIAQIIEENDLPY